MINNITDASKTDCNSYCSGKSERNHHLPSTKYKTDKYYYLQVYFTNIKNTMCYSFFQKYKEHFSTRETYKAQLAAKSFPQRLLESDGYSIETARL